MEILAEVETLRRWERPPSPHCPQGLSFESSLSKRPEGSIMLP